MPSRFSDRHGWPFSNPVNVAFIPNRNSPQYNGLIAWWPLGMAQYGMRRDVMGRWHVIPVNSPTILGSDRGCHTHFDVALTQYLSYAGSVRSSFPMSITCWFYCETTTANRNMFSQGINAANRMYLLVTSAGALRGQVITSAGNDTDISIAGVGTGMTFHHAAFVLSTNNSSLYLDGGNKATDNTSDPPGATYTATRIGAAYNNAAPFDGGISDLRVYNRYLSDREVFEFYSNPWELSCPNTPYVFAKPPVAAARIPRYGFTNFQIPGVV